MNVGTLIRWIPVAIAATLPVAGFAVSYNATVGRLQSTNASSDCVFFTLNGVSEADPVKPGDPWFAMARSQYGAKEAYAMLLSAKLTGEMLYVQTSGTLACGYASVHAITTQ